MSSVPTARTPATRVGGVAEDRPSHDGSEGDDRGQVEARETREGALPEETDDDDDAEVEDDAGDDDAQGVDAVESVFVPFHAGHLPTASYSAGGGDPAPLTRRFRLGTPLLL
ncbi:hypothetical protein M3G00_11535 [Brevibacterium casei]|uniref:hypothetical protein n=1 Tax=Brevibacterium casei TaxID=33889 RepID=UPI00223BDF60|nr:hypothetical protein [Brevibacterium casei]MCT2183567.1 hypothetical protein [Brevibacterium casei]